MKRISLCTPAWRRHELTETMFEQRARTFEAAARLGVECQCVVVSDEPVLLDMATRHNFMPLEVPNRLARRYNEGHEWAWHNEYDISFHCNSDQVFTPELLAMLARAPSDKITLTHWLTAVNESGKKAISARNPTWAMLAIPTELLTATGGRPIANEDLMSGCDRALFEGVAKSNRLDAYIGGDERIWEVFGRDVHHVEDSPLDVVQFESGNQLTPWKRWLLVAMATGTMEQEVPWEGIRLTYGDALVQKMKGFYGVG